MYQMNDNMAKEIYYRITHIKQYQNIVNYLNKKMNEMINDLYDSLDVKGIDYSYKPPKTSTDTHSMEHRIADGITDESRIDSQIKEARMDLMRAQSYVNQILMYGDSDDEQFIKALINGDEAFFSNNYKHAITLIKRYCTY